MDMNDIDQIAGNEKRKPELDEWLYNVQESYPRLHIKGDDVEMKECSLVFQDKPKVSNPLLGDLEDEGLSWGSKKKWQLYCPRKEKHYELMDVQEAYLKREKEELF